LTCRLQRRQQLRHLSLDHEWRRRRHVDRHRVTGTSYTDTGLTNGTTYYYKVAAVNAGGQSPQSAEVSATPSAQVVMGEPNVLSSVDSNNANWLIAQQATLAQTATLQSLSFYASQAAGTVLLGVYDASGPSGGPGKLLASTNTITPVAGWNTASVVTPVSLTAGTYWLAFLPSSNSLGVPIASTGSAAWYQYTYGPLPTTFSATPTDATAHWSVYATLNLQTPGTLVTAISTGGPASGAFATDADFSGGTVSGGTTAAINTSQVTNPAPQSVYQHGRYGNMTYTIPNLTPGETYRVQLDFVEYYWSAPGQRVFNVAINGTQVLSNFDIFAAAGGKDIAIARSFTATASSSGTITITFTSLVDNAMINGIEIYTV
jgi:fibronectin type 3 domain-containing protein